MTFDKATQRNLMLCLVLSGVTLALYLPSRVFDLVYYDDPLVMTNVEALHHGWTWAGVKWAWTSVVVGNWHPVTNLSFLALTQFFGMAPGPQHLANAIIHSANAVLLFRLLQRLTGTTWRCAVTAAIFAWHPLRVESVAWVSERKDVLCAFFFFLSLLGYAVHVQSHGAGKKPSRLAYGLCLAAFALALLSKPMAVTLPFVLLLLDFWPLQRLAVEVDAKGLPPTRQGLPVWIHLLMEKWPFFLLTALFCVLTFCAQKNSSAVIPWNALSFVDRLANAITAYCAYPAKMFWPVDLAVIYQLYPWHDYGEIALKGALLATVTLGCVVEWRKRPWLAAGWFWYLATALPVIGLVQVGEQAMADRYTYIPLIGPTLAVVWMVAEGCSKLRNGTMLGASATLAVSAVLLVLSGRQLQSWRNQVELFSHAIDVTPMNPTAMYNLGYGFEHTGQTRLAITAYRVTLMMTPYEPNTRSALAAIYIQQGRLKDAEVLFREYLAHRPDEFQANYGLAILLAQEGRERDCIEQLRKVAAIRDDVPEVLNNLAWALATSADGALRDGPQAVKLARRACELTHYEQPLILGTLAAAYAEAAQFDEAVKTADKACALGAALGDTNLVRRNQELMQLYKTHRAYHEKELRNPNNK